MYTYGATFTTGFSNTVERLLRGKIKSCHIVKTLDGLIIFKCNEDLLNVKFPFLNNLFIIISYIETNSLVEYNLSLKHLVDNTLIDYRILDKYVKRNTDFKILNIDKNQPVSINYRIIEPLEEDLSTIYNLKINKKNPKTEFVILRRNENIMLFMLKISSNRQTEKFLQKGELRPELANLIISQIDLDKSCIVMDPFCGNGSIPKEIVKHFQYNMCFASDIDEELVNKLKKEYKGNNKKLFIKQRDALNLDYFQNEFLDAIITDPPWNIYNEQEIDIVKFYYDMLKEFKRIIKNNGKLVVLMGNVDNFEKALLKIDGFDLKNKIYTLVNGKKACLYVFEKNV